MLPIVKGGTVYILTNKNHTVLYVGVTSNLQQRMHQHISKYYVGSFTARYNVDKLVYYKVYDSIEEAIKEEKRIKGGSRQQKIKMINTLNKDWLDLWEVEVRHW